MRECAERAVLKELGSGVELYFPSNAPCGFQYYAYPEDVQEKENCYGAKVFYYAANYVEGTLQLKDGLVDHAWATPTEVGDFMDAKSYPYVQKILIP